MLARDDVEQHGCMPTEIEGYVVAELAVAFNAYRLCSALAYNFRMPDVHVCRVELRVAPVAYTMLQNVRNVRMVDHAEQIDAFWDGAWHGYKLSGFLHASHYPTNMPLRWRSQRSMRRVPSFEGLERDAAELRIIHKARMVVGSVTTGSGPKPQLDRRS